MMDDFDAGEDSPSIDDELSFPKKNGTGEKRGGSCRRNCCILLLLGSALCGFLYGLVEIYDIPILDQLGGALNFDDKSGEVGNNANNDKTQDALVNGHKGHSQSLNQWQQSMKDKHKNGWNFNHSNILHNHTYWSHRANITKPGNNLWDRPPQNNNKGNDGGGKVGKVTSEAEQVNNHGSVTKQHPDAITTTQSNNPHSDWLNAVVSKSDGIMFEVVGQMEHDPTAFTQGLTYHNGVLYESTGLYGGKSSIRKLDPQTGKALQVVNMDAQYFGEGMTFCNGLLIQITWKKKKGFMYNANNLEQKPIEFDYETTNGEGWGITYDSINDDIIVSDGSNNLHFWKIMDIGNTKRKVSVMRQDGTPARKINELEFWRGRVLANVWYEDTILVINPETGIVEKEYNFLDLWPKAERPSGTDVLNGISVSEDPDVLYITGKKWNRIYRVKLLTASPDSSATDEVNNDDQTDSKGDPIQNPASMGGDSNEMQGGPPITTENNSNQGNTATISSQSNEGQSSEPLNEDIDNSPGKIVGVGVQGMGPSPSPGVIDSQEPNTSVVVEEEKTQQVQVVNATSKYEGTENGSVPAQNVNEVDNDQIVTIPATKDTIIGVHENADQIDTNGNTAQDTNAIPLDQDEKTTIEQTDEAKNDSDGSLEQETPPETKQDGETATILPESNETSEQATSQASEQQEQVSASEVPADQSEATATVDGIAGSQEENPGAVPQITEQQEQTDHTDPTPVEQSESTASAEDAAESQEGNPGSIPQTTEQQEQTDQTDVVNGDQSESTVTAEDAGESQEGNTGSTPHTTEQQEQTDHTDPTPVEQSESTTNAEDAAESQEGNPGSIPQTTEEQEQNDQTDVVDGGQSESTVTAEDSGESQEGNPGFTPHTTEQQEQTDQTDAVPVDQSEPTTNAKDTAQSQEDNSGSTPNTTEQQEQTGQTDIVNGDQSESTVTAEDAGESQQGNTGSTPQTAGQQEQTDHTDPTPVEQSESTTNAEDAAESQQGNTGSIPQTTEQQEQNDQTDVVDGDQSESTVTAEDAGESQEGNRGSTPQTAEEPEQTDQTGALPVHQSESNAPESQEDNLGSTLQTTEQQEQTGQIDVVPVDQDVAVATAEDAAESQDGNRTKNF